MPLTTFIKDSENWLRLAMFILGPLREALLNILHDSTFGVPRERTDLFTVLTNQRVKFRRLKPDQLNLLFPPGQQQTDSNLFDITLIVFLIKTCTNLKPDTFWKDFSPAVGDVSLAADVIRILLLRNALQHYSSTNKLENNEFEQKWLEGTNILQRLRYTGHDIELFKTITLDSKHYLVYRSLIIYLQCQQEELCDNVKENSDKLRELDSVPMGIKKLKDDLDDLEISVVLLESVVPKNSSEMNDKIDEILSTIEDRFNLLETVRNEFKDWLRKLEQGALFFILAYIV